MGDRTPAPSGRADQALKTGRTRLWVAGLVLLLVAGGGFLILRGDGTQVIPAFDPPGDHRSADETSTLDDAATKLLSQLQAGLSSGSRREVVALAASRRPGVPAELGSIFDNVRELGLRDLSLRYVDVNQGRVGGKDWVADVEIAWRIGGFDKAPSRMEVPFTFAQAAGGAAFVAVGDDPDGAVPLWLLDELTVERSRRALVMVADRAGVPDFSSLADRAAADVERVLPRWRGKLVVEVPGSETDLERTVGSEDNTYQAIAAVTSTVDGSLNPSSPAHILVNPTVFGRLGDEGAQIVMSHEATHVATSAALSTMPMWLLEGFADYVALAHVELPVSMTASQILAQVRESGPPRQLPEAGDFDPRNKALGTSYEAAWLACRLIGERYGEQELIDLYEAVDGGLPVEDGFEQLLGTDQRAFTSQWQSYLRRLA